MGAVEKNGEDTDTACVQCSDIVLCSRAQVLFCAMVSGFDSVHVRANLPRLEEAVKYGNSAGDR
jgi:hypothetical protein